MEWLLVWIVMGGVVAMIAHSRGRSALGWFVYGVAIWPIALTHILIARPTETDVTARAGRAAREADATAKAGQKGRAPCPHCAEHVKIEASVCPHCQRDLPENWWWSEERRRQEDRSRVLRDRMKTN